MTVETRVRPIKQFKVIVAYGPYRVGDKIQPTGMYRDVLLKRGLIQEVIDEPEEKREAKVEANRMISQKGQDSLFTRSKRGR